jgi:hypothetical protein
MWRVSLSAASKRIKSGLAAQSEFSGASPNAHLLIGQMPAPHQLHGPGWEGTGLSIAAHAILFGILAYAATHVSQVAQTASDATGRFKVVFLDRAGAGDGDRGGGPTASDPPRPAQLIQAKPIEITPAAVSPGSGPRSRKVVRQYCRLPRASCLLSSVFGHRLLSGNRRCPAPS